MTLEKDHTETRERILLAAKKEFAEKGFDGARMGSIARKAKANQALIHYYFNTKENLYVQVLHRLFGIREKEFSLEIETLKGLSPSQQLYIDIYIIVFTHMEAADYDYNRILAIELAGGFRFLRQISQQYFIPWMEKMEQVVIDGVDKGEFETRDALLVVLNIIFFIINYGNSREYYKETRFYKRLFDGSEKQRLFTFLLEHTFKALCPRGREFQIPDISKDIQNQLDAVVNSILREQKGEMVKDA